MTASLIALQGLYRAPLINLDLVWPLALLVLWPFPHCFIHTLDWQVSLIQGQTHMFKDKDLLCMHVHI